MHEQTNELYPITTLISMVYDIDTHYLKIIIISEFDLQKKFHIYCKYGFEIFGIIIKINPQLPKSSKNRNNYNNKYE